MHNVRETKMATDAAAHRKFATKQVSCKSSRRLRAIGAYVRFRTASGSVVAGGGVVEVLHPVVLAWGT